jgi:hypothetical protein
LIKSPDPSDTLPKEQRDHRQDEEFYGKVEEAESWLKEGKFKEIKRDSLGLVCSGCAVAECAENLA